MRTKAAILVELNQPLVLDEIEIPSLKQGQVLIEVKYSGVCHTQLLEARGHRGKDPFLPHLLGHEGSGIVVECGPGVERVKAGDHVILSWMKGSGANVPGTVYEWKGRKVNAGAITTFSNYSVISENRLTVIPKEFPLKEAALVGCALATGLGTVFNTARPQAGESLAVFGCGGVGLCAVLGAKIAGCTPLIAIDINPDKLKIAQACGATHTIDASKEDPVEVLKKLGALDYAIESSGSPIAMDQAFKSVRPQGGMAVIIGNAKHGQLVSLDPWHFNQGKRLLGTWGGDNLPDIHFPRYCKLISNQSVYLEPFMSHTYTLDQIDLALNNLERGLNLRPLIVL